MRGVLFCSLAFASGCTISEDIAGKNGELGIARFEIDETATTTTVVGRDADGRQVGRLELIHGVFDSEEYGKAVDGRKLDILVMGQSTKWETEGYEPYLDMPAPPSSHSLIAAFMVDSHVKPVLDRWQIGWNGGGLADEAGYTVNTRPGSFVQDCEGASDCGTLINTGAFYAPTYPTFTVNTCGGGALALDAVRIVDAEFARTDSVSQCCPAGSGQQANNWFAIKLCPKDGTTTACGSVINGACKACNTWGYPTAAQAFCRIWFDPSESRVESAYSPTLLQKGEKCIDPELWWGFCDTGLICMDQDPTGCQLGEVCTCQEP